MTISEQSWDEADGFVRDAIHYPSRPLRRLDACYVVDTLQPGSAPGMDEWSLPMACVEDRLVHGWVFTRIVPVGGSAPAVLARFTSLAHLWRVIPPLRRRIKGFQRFLRAGGFEGQLDTWQDVWRPEALARLAPLRAFDLSSSSGSDLARHLEAWRDYLTWQWSPHVRIHMVCFTVRGRFAEVCRRLLDLDPLASYDLLRRSDPVLLEAPRALAAIAKRAAADPAVSDALGLPPGRALEDLRGTWFEKELSVFLDAHGDVPCDGFEVSLPTLRLMPERVVAVVARMMRERYDPEAERVRFEEWRAARVSELRARLDDAGRAEFDRWLGLGERAYPLNDTHNHLLLELPAGLVHYACVRAGELLREAGRLDAADDVFWLDLDELTAELRSLDSGGAGPDLRGLVAARAAEFDAASRLQVPAAVGEQALPPLHVFPREVAEALQLLLDQNDQMTGGAQAGVADQPGSADATVASGQPDVSEPSSDASSAALVVSGIAGAPGIAEGPVRVVLQVAGLDAVQPGDILVCPITGPAWTVVFPVIAGLITEAGGPLSHPAIVAREFGIPSVVGTRDATKRLVDGQVVRLDGSAGTVTVAVRAP